MAADLFDFKVEIHLNETSDHYDVLWIARYGSGHEVNCDGQLFEFLLHILFHRIYAEGASIPQKKKLPEAVLYLLQTVLCQEFFFGNRF